MKFNNYTSLEVLTTLEKQRIVDFLFDHLDEYGDSKNDIGNAIDYAMSSYPLAGGFILTAEEDDEIKGAVVMNKTGMKGYIPENILVYIAVHRDQRGKGLGKKLMKEAMVFVKGDIALHVEEDNPARYLYEKTGFENKYLEMRLIRNK
ncbi:MAG: GNAT family N-acetyltransferase [Bacteroidales bacterium]|jgi:GNAT superfamily N-acetyltransferase|nr:GNAT family N-acetyltransferase [Bacteroidales bacterium]